MSGSMLESLSQLTTPVSFLYSHVRGVVVPRPCIAMILEDISKLIYTARWDVAYSTDVLSSASSDGYTLSKRPSGGFVESYATYMRIEKCIVWDICAYFHRFHTGVFINN